MHSPENYTDRVCREQTGRAVYELIDAITETIHVLIHEIRDTRFALDRSDAALRAHAQHQTPADVDVAAEEPERDAKFRRLLEQAQTYLPKQ